MYLTPPCPPLGPGPFSLPICCYACLENRCRALCGTVLSDKKRGPKPKLFGPDIFGWDEGLPCEGVGAKRFGLSFETQENQTFWQDIPGFCRDIPEVPERFEKKVCVHLWAPISWNENIKHFSVSLFGEMFTCASAPWERCPA